MANKKTPNQIEYLVNEYVDTNVEEPEKLHILFDKNTRTAVDQYDMALKVARGIPFNTESVSITDPLSLIIAKQYAEQDGNKVVRMAAQHYEKWAYDVQQHSWLLGLLVDNEFINIPEPWEVSKAPPGLPEIPEPSLNLSHPLEYRLKQIIDFLGSDMMLQSRVMTIINNSMAKIVADVEGVTDTAGFQPVSANDDIPAQTSADDNNTRKRTKRTKDKEQSSGTGEVAEAT